MKVFCIGCKRHTNHKVVAKHKEAYTPEDNPAMQVAFAGGEWQILQCKGCEEITFREVWVNSDDVNPATGEMEESVRLYPQRGKDTLPGKSLYNVPRNIRRIYQEIIDCYNAEIHTLCAGGLRAIIEAICAHKNIRSGLVDSVRIDGSKVTKRKKNLEAKIEGLTEKRLLTQQHSKVLHQHRFLGNEALHELDQPSRKELRVAIEIVEHTLENIYELEDKAKALRRMRKLRKRKK